MSLGAPLSNVDRIHRPHFSHIHKIIVSKYFYYTGIDFDGYFVFCFTLSVGFEAIFFLPFFDPLYRQFLLTLCTRILINPLGFYRSRIARVLIVVEDQVQCTVLWMCTISSPEICLKARGDRDDNAFPLSVKFRSLSRILHWTVLDRWWGFCGRSSSHVFLLSLNILSFTSVTF